MKGGQVKIGRFLVLFCAVKVESDQIGPDTSSSRTSSHSQEQLLLELDMYQDIAVARGSTYDTLNKRMDRCQENIETVSDDIRRLQGE